MGILATQNPLIRCNTDLLSHTLSLMRGKAPNMPVPKMVRLFCTMGTLRLVDDVLLPELDQRLSYCVKTLATEQCHKILRASNSFPKQCSRLRKEVAKVLQH